MFDASLSNKEEIDQQHPFFLPSGSPPATLTMPWFCAAPSANCAVVKSLATSSKTASTPCPVFALASRNIFAPHFWAKASPSAKVTCLAPPESKSHLFPTRATIASSPRTLRRSSSHPSTCSKLSLLVMSYTMMPASAPLRKFGVNERKTSWPAVSHMRSLTGRSRRSGSSTVFAKNSHPIVASCLPEKDENLRRKRMDDLPTVESPRITTLYFLSDMFLNQVAHCCVANGEVDLSPM